MSIVGLIDRFGENIFNQIVLMLKSTQHRGSGSYILSINGHNVIADKIEKIVKSEIKGSIGIGQHKFEADEIRKTEPSVEFKKGTQIFFSGEIYNLSELTEKFQISFASSEEAVLQLFEYNFVRNSNKIVPAVKRMPCQLDGMYAFAILYEGKIILCRDQIGLKPLYYFYDERFFAFASEQKAMWNIGLTENIKSLEPGSFMIVTNRNLSKTVFHNIKAQDISKISLEEAKQKTISLLMKSVQKMMQKEIGILFSGGLDSSIIAKIAKNFSSELTLYCAGFPNCRDINNARRASQLLGIRLHEYILNIDEVRKDLPNILYITEDPNIMNLSIAVPIYYATKLARQEGIKIMFSGQGGDEIFVGYKRYEHILEQKGGESLQKELLNDMLEIASKNLKREEAVSMANNVEIRMPYLDMPLLNFMMKVPLDYKINKQHSTLIKKYILRLVAKELGIPDELCNLPKIAVQYGSTSMKIIKFIARNEYSNSIDPNKGKHNLTQLYLNDLAKKVGIPDTVINAP